MARRMQYCNACSSSTFSLFKCYISDRKYNFLLCLCQICVWLMWVVQACSKIPLLLQFSVICWWECWMHLSVISMFQMKNVSSWHVVYKYVDFKTFHQCTWHLMSRSNSWECTAHTMTQNVLPVEKIWNLYINTNSLLNSWILLKS